ncbi:alpha/beta fold hydrolase [Haloimpatiens sp. FM7330]|uniref:alpha/beta fold hydrolase n=1 Tax=Haloimpatiens sp. FM7330 TaxID=3298610 RepID=UPI0036263D8B
MFELISGPYDLKFGDTFYDCSWFKNYDQSETLARIDCPSIFIHTSWHYDENGILLAAMDDKDVNRAHSLIKNNVLVDVVSGHDFHYEKPKEFTQIMVNFLDKIQ